LDVNRFSKSKKKKNIKMKQQSNSCIKSSLQGAVYGASLLFAFLASFQAVGAVSESPPNYIPEFPEHLREAGQELSKDEHQMLYELAKSEKLNETEISVIRRAKFPQLHADLPDVPANLEVVLAELSVTKTLALNSHAAAATSAANLGMEYVPGYYIVRFRNEEFPYALRKKGGGVRELVDVEGMTLTARALDLAALHGGEVIKTWSLAVAGFSVKLTEREADKLASHPAIASVEPDGLIHAHITQFTPPSWGLNRITNENLSLEDVYRYFNMGDGVRIYIADTGIRTTHHQFPDQGAHYDATGLGINDGDGHGTFTAGIALGSGDVGVAKDATAIAIKVLNNNGSGTLAWILDGIDEIIDMHDPGHRAVANFSLGGPSNSSINTAIDNLVLEGVTVVVSAGNDGQDASGYSPAGVSSAITVGASTENDSFVTFAQTGDFWASNHGALVDVIAPGLNITSTGTASDTDEVTIQHAGTSAAAPHVAGTAAKLLEWDPTLTPAQIEQLIIDNATTGKLANVPAGTADRLLFDNKFFYPFHSFAEWQNSDTAATSTTWFFRAELGGWWMAHPNNYPWFWSDPDQDWYMYLTGDPFLTFQRASDGNLLVLNYRWK
jgi:hypothetical protein